MEQTDEPAPLGTGTGIVVQVDTSADDERSNVLVGPAGDAIQLPMVNVGPVETGCIDLDRLGRIVDNNITVFATVLDIGEGPLVVVHQTATPRKGAGW